MQCSLKSRRTVFFAAIVIIVSMVSQHGFAQDSPRRYASFITVNGSLATAQMTAKPERFTSNSSPNEVWGNVNVGWLNYWQQFSAEIQFAFAPFAAPLPNPRNITSSGLQCWLGYAVWETSLVRVSPVFGFGSYRFSGASTDEVLNGNLSLGVGCEAFLPNSRIMLGLRCGYQHNFFWASATDSPLGNMGGIIAQIRTGIAFAQR